MTATSEDATRGCGPSADRLQAPPPPVESTPTRGGLSSFLAALGRKKPLDCRTETSLNRCLGLLDLTALGVGSTLGLGLYIQAGQVASTKAGPAVILSFGFAALASAFSALCYAEFAGLVPKAGSAYAYSYITVGEFAAFIIGWNLVLEYAIGASSVTRGLSNYLAQLCRRLESLWILPEPTPIAGEGAGQKWSAVSSFSNHTMAPPSAATTTTTTTNVWQDDFAAGWLPVLLEHLTRHFDWLSLVIVALLTVLLLLGVKDSTNITMVFTGVNLLVVSVVVVASLGVLDRRNWQLAPSEVPAWAGRGGFLPYGWAGVLAGSSTCFYAFIGFDTIATSAEEARNPRRNIPLSILLSLGVSFVAYMAVATCQTLMWPYYDQNTATILPDIFRRLGMGPIEWVVLIGALAGLSSSQLGGIYPLPRVLYSMAQDRLIYGQLARVSRRLQLPVRAIFVGSILVGSLACLLDIEALTDMVSIGTLAAYSLVSLSVLLLRYEPRPDHVTDATPSPRPHQASRLSFSDLLEMADKIPAPTEELDDQQHDQDSQQPPPSSDTSNKKDPLSAKQSTPIRTIGSKPLEPQLSGGFGSWFKDTAGPQQEVPTGPAATADQRSPRSLLDLLSVTWAWEDHCRKFTDGPPDEWTCSQSRRLIGALMGLCLLVNLVALCSFPSASSPAPGAPVAPVGPLLEARLAGAIACLLLAVMGVLLVMLSRLPVNKTIHSKDAFQVPWVPLVPTLSILINMGLMLNLNLLTWIRFAVWMAVGLFIYFTYGLWNSRGYLLAASLEEVVESGELPAAKPARG